MKRKFSHEEIVVTSVLVVGFTYILYCFVALVYNALTYGVHMNI
jgi:hypothetical protein